MSKGTPRQSFRIPPDLWGQAQATAERVGETLTSVVVAALRAYVRKNQAKEQK